jgi:hypothetical protein
VHRSTNTAPSLHPANKEYSDEEDGQHHGTLKQTRSAIWREPEGAFDEIHAVFVATIARTKVESWRVCDEHENCRLRVAQRQGAQA